MNKLKENCNQQTTCTISANNRAYGFLRNPFLSALEVTICDFQNVNSSFFATTSNYFVHRTWYYLYVKKSPVRKSYWACWSFFLFIASRRLLISSIYPAVMMPEGKAMMAMPTIDDMILMRRPLAEMG